MLWLAAISALVFLVLLEVGVRRFIFSSVYTAPDLGFPIAAPGVSLKVAPYTMFSRFEYPGEKIPRKSGETRIFVTGGSTVQYGDPPIPALLERKLHARGHAGVRVFNYGVESVRSGQELAHICFHIARSSPDMIIMYNGGNDILDALVWEPRPGYPFAFAALENNPLFKPPESYPLFTLIAYGSGLLRYVFAQFFATRLVNDYDKLDHLRIRIGYGTDAWKERIADAYVQNVTSAARIASALDARFLCFFQPLVHFKPTVERGERVGEERRAAAADLRKKIAAKLAGAPWFVDLSGIFESTSAQVFSDEIHVKQKYNEIIAQRMSESSAAALGRPARGKG